MIEYKDISPEALPAVRTLYAAHGWTAYLQDDAQLTRAFDRTLCMMGAFEGETLVGFVRCVGDGEHVLLLQDLIVHPAHLRQGIGSELIRRVRQRFAHVRMMLLMTDAMDDRANAFYRAAGLHTLDQSGIIGYLL